MKENDDLRLFCENEVSLHNEVFSTVYDYIGFIVRNLSFRRCQCCGKLLDYKHLKYNEQSCSTRCAEKNPKKYEKIKKTFLDRSWYNNIEIPGYVLKKELAPKIINRKNYKVENCGYLKYEKV